MNTNILKEIGGFLEVMLDSSDFHEDYHIPYLNRSFREVYDEVVKICFDNDYKTSLDEQDINFLCSDLVEYHFHRKNGVDIQGLIQANDIRRLEMFLKHVDTSKPSFTSYQKDLYKIFGTRYILNVNEWLLADLKLSLKDCAYAKEISIFTKRSVEEFLTYQDYPHLEALTIRVEGLTDLSFLSNFPNLKHLEVSLASEWPRFNLPPIPLPNDISNNLKTLTLSKVKVSKIPEHLEMLILSRCELSSDVILPSTLIYLNIEMSSLSDVTFVSNLPNLTHLLLNNNNISDVSPIGTLIKLHTLDLSHNNISDISPLCELVDLKELSVSSNKIENIYVLMHLTNLTHIDLVSNRTKDVGTLLSQLGYQFMFPDRNIQTKVGIKSYNFVKKPRC